MMRRNMRWKSLRLGSRNRILCRIVKPITHNLHRPEVSTVYDITARLRSMSSSLIDKHTLLLPVDYITYHHFVIIRNQTLVGLLAR